MIYFVLNKNAGVGGERVFPGSEQNKQTGKCVFNNGKKLDIIVHFLIRLQLSTEGLLELTREQDRSIPIAVDSRVAIRLTLPKVLRLLLALELDNGTSPIFFRCQNRLCV